MRNGKKKRKVKFSDESRRVGRSLIIANKSIKETENLIFFFQCKIEFYFSHEHQTLYFHSWPPPLESRRVGRTLIIANKSIKETENLIFFFSVRSNIISFMNTKTCIFTRHCHKIISVSFYSGIMNNIANIGTQCTVRCVKRTLEKFRLKIFGSRNY